MKRIISILAIAVMSAIGLDLYGQTVVYLSDAFKPVDSHGYTRASELVYGGAMEIGGMRYKKGFEMRTTEGPTQLGYAEFSLNGKYKTINFIIGSTETNSVSKKKSIVIVTADGKKLMDKIISACDVPQRVSLDITGVDKLKFEIVREGTRIGIAEPTLWTAGQTPRETGVLTSSVAKPTMLVRDLRPYKQNVYHRCVSQDKNYDDRREIKINGKSYQNGLDCAANQALVGDAWAWTYFNVGGNFSTLQFVAGPKDSDSGTIGEGWLTVKADDKIIYEYEVSQEDVARVVTLDISGCKSLSFETEQTKGSLSIAATDIMVYPAGYTVPSVQTSAGSSEQLLSASDEVRSLPDVCKLISNIPPYAVGGGIDRENMVYDGKSDYLTFSMGGVKFNEGLILQSTTHVLNDNTGSHAIFNLGGEFDYVSFTTGWISKCGVLKNDVLMVYADDEEICEIPLIATAPNQQYIVPINKCKKLTFKKKGISSMDHPAFGVADIVLYRGKAVENDLFVHPKPDCPDKIDLIDLSRPYIHYVYVYRDQQDQLLKDGSTKKDYFAMPNGERIYKGFCLKTSVHFSSEMGPTGSPDVGIMGGMMGSAILVGAAGGAAITAVSPFGALIALASGGTALESSCAAFNVWGEYDTVTFTVACRQSHNTGGDTIDVKTNPIDKLLIGADGNVVSEIELYEKMQPTTYTVPINKASQLMFWIECGDWDSGQYIFYDLKLSKGA